MELIDKLAVAVGYGMLVAYISAVGAAKATHAYVADVIIGGAPGLTWKDLWDTCCEMEVEALFGLD